MTQLPNGILQGLPLETVRFFRPSLASLLTLGGLVLAIAGVSQPWYQLPESLLNQLETDLAAVAVIKGTAIAAALAACVCWLLKAASLARFLLWQGLIALLLMPYLLTTWVPNLDAITVHLDEQNQQIVRHVEHNFPVVQAQWKRNIGLLAERTAPTGIGLKIADARFFQLSTWDYWLLEGLGYRNSCLAFLGKGWITGLVGLTAALIGRYAAVPGRDALQADIGWLLPQAATVLGAIFIVILTVNLLEARLDSWLLQGRYDRIAVVSQGLEQWYPPLTNDEQFQNRLAQARHYGGQSEQGDTSLAQGIEQFRRGEYDAAVSLCQQALAQQPGSFLARKYLAAALLNRGVDYFETPLLPNRPSRASFPSRANFLESPKARQGPVRAKPAGAIAAFEAALAVFPGHPIALYNLMLAHSINGSFPAAADAATALIDLQAYFQQPNTALLGQVYTHLAWASYHGDKFDSAWQNHRRSVNPALWP